MWSLLQDGRVCDEALLRRGLVVALRLPSLFIADAWAKTDPEALHAFTRDSRLVDGSGGGHHVVVLVEMLYYASLGLALSLVVLPPRHLVHLYVVVISAVLVFIANILSARFVQEEESYMTSSVATDTVLEMVRNVAPYLLLQYGISSAVAQLLGVRRHLGARLVLLVYSLPLLTRLCGMPVSELSRVHHASSTFMLLLSVLYLMNKLMMAMEVVRNGINCALTTVYICGWFEFLVAIWVQMCLPLQFLVFWVVLFTVKLYQYYEADSHPVWSEGWSVVLLASMSDNCGSPLGFLGACVTVTYLSEAVLRSAASYLGRDVRDLSRGILSPGFTEGVIMFCLGVQTGLVELKSADRIILLTVVLFVVLSSLIQSLFEISDPVLLWLAASQNKNISKHVRAVVLSTFLWVFPIMMAARICRLFDLDLWLLIILSSYILTSLRVLGALFIYALVIFDSLRRLPFEHLDDVIYYTKCLVHVLEFSIAVVVVGYGVKRSVLGSWSWLNSLILVLHSYCNVWQRLQSGWLSYLQRRDAMSRVNTMKVASSLQLVTHDDLCAICYQRMVSARVTPCQHLFHGVCLRKWLFIQDYCPICHQKILNVSDEVSQLDHSDGQLPR